MGCSLDNNGARSRRADERPAVPASAAGRDVASVDVVDLRARVTALFADSARTTLLAGELLAPAIAQASSILVDSLRAGGKILTCGNGGSAADAQHLSSELMNRFERNRPALPAIALASDASALTSIANDDAFAEVFARQISGLGRPEDVLVVITTSGRSTNVGRAVETAHRQQMRVIALTGRDGGRLAKLLLPQDMEIRVPASSTARIQEVHTVVLHCLCDLLDQQLFGGRQHRNGV